jgi:hypothetical protein
VDAAWGLQKFQYMWLRQPWYIKAALGHQLHQKTGRAGFKPPWAEAAVFKEQKQINQ